VHQQAFDNVKATIAKEVTLAYPNYSEEFEIYTYGSKKQGITQRTGRLLLKLSKNTGLTKLNSWP
jgi:hypothetical protein